MCELAGHFLFLCLRSGTLKIPCTIVCLGLSALFCAFLQAQVVPGTDFEQQGVEQDFLVRVWDTADGLLPTSIRDISQTKDGYVWMATSDGLVWFDGSRARIFRKTGDASSRNLARVLCTHGDHSGRLWATTSDGALFMLEKSRWREFTKADGWTGTTLEPWRRMPQAACGLSAEQTSSGVMRAGCPRCRCPSFPPVSAARFRFWAIPPAKSG